MRSKVLSVLLILWGAGGLAAQGPNPGARVLELPASTRALALGDAFVTVGGDPDAIFYNPGLLTAARGIGLAVQRRGSTVRTGSISAAVEMAPGGLGVGVRVLDRRATVRSATTEVADVDAPAGEGTLLITGLAASVAYARPVLGVRLGVAGVYVEERIGNERDGTFGVDMGAAYSLGVATVGLAVRNLGGTLRLNSHLDEVPLPRRVVLNAAHPRAMVGPFDVITAASLAATASGAVEAALGVEVAWWPVVGRTFIARLGSRTREDAALRGFTAGAGFTGDRFSLDYAYDPYRGGDAAHRFGMRWR